MRCIMQPKAVSLDTIINNLPPPILLAVLQSCNSKDTGLSVIGVSQQEILQLALESSWLRAWIGQAYLQT